MTLWMCVTEELLIIARSQIDSSMLRVGKKGEKLPFWSYFYFILLKGVCLKCVLFTSLQSLFVRCLR